MQQERHDSFIVSNITWGIEAGIINVSYPVYARREHEHDYRVLQWRSFPEGSLVIANIAYGFNKVSMSKRKAQRQAVYT